MLRLLALLLAALPALAGAQSATTDPFGDNPDPFADFDAAFEEESGRATVSGFIEAAYGRRFSTAASIAERNTLAELRARLETGWVGARVRGTLRGDAVYDDVASDSRIDWRDLSLGFSPGGKVDLKVGRQVLTWGTGDLVFLNDLFPKSWVGFFAGRDDEYLKAPSDAVRTIWYSDQLNVDLVWSPQFEPDQYLTGERFSFFSPLAGMIVAPRPVLAATEPDRRFENGELALRLFRTLGSTEYAGYYYRGFFKRPLGLTPDLAPSFPQLQVIGGSVRRPLGRGLINAEFAYHDSRADAADSDPLIPNDQLRLLLGYEFEARPRFNVGLQYYLERTLDYANLLANSLAPEFEPDRTRHLLTGRLTWRSSRDTVTLSLFTFYSPSDRDYYLRPNISYRKSDQWTYAAGANLFRGAEQHTFFGQLEDNANAWFRVRLNY